jgi:hypothetical protein
VTMPMVEPGGATFPMSGVMPERYTPGR